MTELAPGAPAPDVTLPTDDRGTLSLASLRGAPVVLYFYPKDNTPGCTTEACDFRDEHSDLTAHGAVVVGVSPDSLRSHQGFRERHALPFPLASDPDFAIAQAFGVYRTKKQYGREYMGVVRTTFLIDAQGRIAQIWDPVRVHRTRGGQTIRHVDEVLEALRALPA